MYEKIEEGIRCHGIIAICRNIRQDDLLHLADALLEGGIRYLEVTFDPTDPTSNVRTPQAIASLTEHFSDMVFGAGTVLTPAQVVATHAAGGKFIISPSTNQSIISLTKDLDMVSIPGAMTPTEIVTAFDAGADIIKLFPAGSLGIEYIKNIRSPLKHIPLLATGGIDVNNLDAFLRAGCCGAGIGNSLCDAQLIADKNWRALTKRALQFVSIHQQTKSL